MSDAEALAREVNSLFSLPDAALRVTELVDRPETKNRELAEVIMHDPALTARVLRLVNSSYFGLPRKIETVSQAIALIGRDELRILILATSVTGAFSTVSEDLVDIEAFWDHSVNTAVLARSLAKRVGLVEADRLFVAGLLHEVGKLAFYSTRPERYREVLEQAEQGREALEACEQLAFGFDHHELGATLLSVWGLPEGLQDLVRYQHTPEQASEVRRLATHALHAATRIATWMQSGLDATRSPVSAKTRLQLALNDAVIEELVRETDMEAMEILQIVAPNAALIY